MQPTARAQTRRGSLLVVGTGISGAGQTTLEAVAAMERAEQLFYLVVDPVTEVWIRQLNPTATSLGDLYKPGKDRARTYAEMTSQLVSSVRTGLRVCAAFYGHPGVFVYSTHAAIRRLRRSGYSARMFPGISADACLFADLGINPGDGGVQSFEATDFLLSRRRFDATSALILWQVGVLGEATSRPGASCRPERLRALTSALRRHYPADHRVVLYYAATFPGENPVIRRMALNRLPEARILASAMLYIPALTSQRPPDPKILAWWRRPD